MFEGWLREIRANVEDAAGAQARGSRPGRRSVRDAVRVQPHRFVVPDPQQRTLRLPRERQLPHRGDAGEGTRGRRPCRPCIRPLRLHLVVSISAGKHRRRHAQSEGDRMVSKYLDLGLEHARILDAPVVVPCGGNLVYYDSVDSIINDAVYTPYDFADYARDRAPDLAPRVYPLVAGDFVLKAGGEQVFSWKRGSTAAYQAALERFLANWSEVNWVEPVPVRAVARSDVAFSRRGWRGRRSNPKNTTWSFRGRTLRISVSASTWRRNRSCWTPPPHPQSLRSGSKFSRPLSGLDERGHPL